MVPSSSLLKIFFFCLLAKVNWSCLPGKLSITDFLLESAFQNLIKSRGGARGCPRKLHLMLTVLELLEGKRLYRPLLSYTALPPLQGPTKYPFLFLPYHLSGGESELTGKSEAITLHSKISLHLAGLHSVTHIFRTLNFYLCRITVQITLE